MLLFFFFNDTATTEIYTLSLRDALPISGGGGPDAGVLLRTHRPLRDRDRGQEGGGQRPAAPGRSEEHTSELQSRLHLVCRLLLEKKKIVDRARGHVPTVPTGEIATTAVT